MARPRTIPMRVNWAQDSYEEGLNLREVVEEEEEEEEEKEVEGEVEEE